MILFPHVNLNNWNNFCKSYKALSMRTTTSRRLIDIYGHEKEYEYDNLSQEKLENKSEYCNQLLHLASILSPGKSELRG